MANSNVTKEALNCTASIAADSIVGAIGFITGVLFCDPKTSFSQVRLRPDLKSWIHRNPSLQLYCYIAQTCIIVWYPVICIEFVYLKH